MATAVDLEAQAANRHKRVPEAIPVRAFLKTEVSYLNREQVPYGTKGSIRFDVLQVNAEGIPVAAWDFKTGAAILTEARICQMVGQFGLNIPICMIK